MKNNKLKKWQIQADNLSSLGFISRISAIFMSVLQNCKIRRERLDQARAGSVNSY